MPPLSVSIHGIRGAISAGVGVTVTCEVVGARPTPSVTWLLEEQRIQGYGDRTKDSDNITESTIILQAGKEDNGRRLTCRAATPGLPQSAMEQHKILKVHCKRKYKVFPFSDFVLSSPS